ncbi:MAG: hypothetical protein ABFC62_01720 [Clostridiaceae bacterium]|nr:hypothetical protein [Eubacteriales bacterium]
MQRIDYEFEDRDALFENLRLAGKVVTADITIDLDENGRLATCYCIVEDAAETEAP